MMKTTNVVNLLDQRERIRNIAVIAHVDHGKTTLVDSLLALAGLINKEEAGKKRLMDTKEEEQQRGITIKSTGISLVFARDSKDYLVNLVDSPGHVDFSSEVTAALRITDGALVVVDCIEGVCVQTEMVTRQALAELIRPVLHINKVDRGIMELQLTPEDLYQKLDAVIRDVNNVFGKFEDEDLGDITVDPRKGNISFGSGKQGWAFTLPQIAKRLAKKTGQDEAKILKRLWGDHFYDPALKRYVSSPISQSGKPLERFVCQVLFKPLITLFQATRDGDMGALEKILPAIDVQLSNKDKDLKGNDLISRILQQWLPAGESLLGLIVDHLPSPVVAQKYRVNKLYTGPLDDPTATAIRNCDPEGPLTIFVSKMVPSTDGSRLFAFGRVFSGTVTPKSTVYVLNSDYVVGKSTVAPKKVSRLVLMMGRFIESVESVPCGNNVGIAGLESSILKTATICSDTSSYPITPMKFTISPVVRRAIAPKNVADLNVFIKGLKKLVNSDPGLQLIHNDNTSECIIAGSGELHIECALNDLKGFIGDGIPFQVSSPIVQFVETVLGVSSQPCLGKSPNKLNRIYVTAEPLDEKLVTALEAHELALDNPKELAASLSRDHAWDKNDAAKLWWFEGTNCLVDMSHSVPYLATVKDHLTAAVKQACAEGVLCGEPLRGVRFNIVDAVLHSDNVHRSSGQIIPTAKRAFLAAQLCAQPALLEPMFLAEIQCAEQKIVSKIYSLLFKKRGNVVEESAKEGSPLIVVKAHLPVLESIGFDGDLREATSGYATPQLMFSHWSPLVGNAFEANSLANKVVLSVRERKKMKLQMPVLSDYNDKL